MIVKLKSGKKMEKLLIQGKTLIFDFSQKKIYTTHYV